MVDNIKLFINDMQVDFSVDPQVLYTYQTTDMSNPTAVKNSFTKTITIDGTPNNNDIFGHYWDVERYLQGGGDGGAFFNSSKKAPFQIFMGSDLYEDGYVKLDDIIKTGSGIKYQVTLYGGLGDFFFNLSSTDDGTEKKLSDLVYMPSGDTNEFNFTANIDTVKEAWDALYSGTAGKWQYINFMPAYNGKPSEFNANKVVMNLSGTSLQVNAKNADDEKWYSVRNGWTVGTLPDDMTEWETRDLRSYLQRPCIRMKEIINACCNPDNNGGYEVDLDSDFFSSTNDYFERTWLSLPMVGNLEYANEEQILESAELRKVNTTGDTSGLMYQDLKFDIGEIQSNVSSIEVNASIAAPSGFNNSSFVWFWNYNGDSYHTGWWCLGSLFCQLLALNGDVVVGASDAFNLTTPIRHNGNLYYGHNGHYPDSTGYDQSTGLRKMGNGSKFIPYMDKAIYNVLGTFNYEGFRREGESSAATLTFRIDNIGSTVTGIKMVYYWGASEDKVKHFSPNYMFQDTYHDAWLSNEYAGQSILASSITMNVVSHNINAVLGESLGRTGTKVTKELLLNTESSPCDYLLSYCKMFGLHFLKDVGEKRIHIMTRKTFYDRTDIKDLENLIDRSKDIHIKPVLFTTKWYEFLQEKDESALQQKYLSTKGVEYGEKVINTGYEFNVEKNNLLKDNCIRSGIECVEKSKYFTAYNNDARLRPWMNLGLKYTMWNGDDTFEYNAGVGNTGTIIPINEGHGMKYYDILPKLQFHGDDNSPCDGNNVLVFFSGFKNVTTGRTNPLTYILSDDTMYQTDFNDGTPCWLFTTQEIVNNKRICYKLDSIPVFERYLTGAESGTVQKSLDFGSAQELYVPNYSLTDDTNIYHSYWRTYLTDLFDVNTRQMTCYIRVLGKPNPEWFRCFYWFDNSIWVLNKLIDWNPTSYNTTKAEFIKVQDIDSYTSESQAVTGTISITPSTYSVHYTGGTVTITVTCDSGVSWRIGVEGGSDVTLSSTGGTGTGTVTATFADNEEDYMVGAYFTATRNDNAYQARCYVAQGYEGEQHITPSPTDLVIPYSGGSANVSFIWYNQGNSYIDYVDYNEGEDYLQFTSDCDTYKTENVAVLTFGENTGDTVLHNYCSFYSDNSDEHCTIGIDQLPEGFDFDFSGGTVTLPVEYATGATFSNVPYWITVVDNIDGTYDIVASDNPTSEPRSGSITLSLGNSSADFNVRQGVDDVFKVQRTDGTGNILPTGSTAVLHVDSLTSWTVTTTSDFVTLSKSGSTETDDMTVTFADNTGMTRQAVFVFTDADNNVINYSITQSGIDGGSVTGDSVTPAILLYDATGGTQSISVNIEDSWRIVGYPSWIAFSPSAGTGTTSVSVTAIPYSGAEQRSGSLVIVNMDTSAPYIVTCIQQPASGGEEILAVSPSSLRFTSSGGTATLTIIANTDWTIA